MYIVINAVINRFITMEQRGQTGRQMNSLKWHEETGNSEEKTKGDQFQQMMVPFLLFSLPKTDCVCLWLIGVTFRLVALFLGVFFSTGLNKQFCPCKNGRKGFGMCLQGFFSVSWCWSRLHHRAGHTHILWCLPLRARTHDGLLVRVPLTMFNSIRLHQLDLCRIYFANNYLIHHFFNHVIIEPR